jgi:hypothetical protein
MLNPLRELYDAVRGGEPSHGTYGEAVAHVRAWCCRHYAWAIPNEEAVKKIASFAPIAEIGAGLGYWAKLISDFNRQNTDFIMGGITAYDTHEQGKQNDWGRSFYKVHPISGETGKRLHPLEWTSAADYTLFVCWPSQKDDGKVLKDCLDLYKGNTLLYVGHWRGLNPFDRRMGHADEPGVEWVMKEKVEIPTWHPMTDALYVFQRKQP